jgi:putative Holliday junction resolvase
MRLGRRIAIDFGAARIGIAMSSIDALISSPLATITAGDSALEEVVELIQQNEPIEIYFGLPLNLSGEFTKSTLDSLAFARTLSSRVSIEVRMVDERLTTRAAQVQLHASGKNSKVSRSLIDAAAASLILEGAIAFEKSTGNQPGKSLLEIDA